MRLQNETDCVARRGEERQVGQGSREAQESHIATHPPVEQASTSNMSRFR